MNLEEWIIAMIGAWWKGVKFALYVIFFIIFLWAIFD